MPKYRYQHHTDGAGIGKKIKGFELGNRLSKLFDQVVKNHRKVKKSMMDVLDYAREAGEALLEAKRRLGHKSKWSKWRFSRIIKPEIMSKETTCNYMRIARNWDDPRIKEARAEGITIDSIRGFLGVLRAEPPENELPKLTHLQAMRQDLRQEFADFLRKCKYEEVKILHDLRFHELRYMIGDAEWLDSIHQQFKRMVCLYLEEDFYGEQKKYKKKRRQIVRRHNEKPVQKRDKEDLRSLSS